MTSLVSSPDLHSTLEENLWSMWSQFGRGPGCALHDDDGALWFETPIPVPPYNMVIRFRGGATADAASATDAVDAAIDAIFRHFRTRGVPFLWFLHPSAAPADLAMRLAARGFVEVEPIAGMTMDLDALPAMPVPPEEVRIHEVTPGDDFGPFLEFVAARWQVDDAARPQLESIAETFRIGVPGSPNRAWIAVKDGVVIAKAFTHDVDEVVGLYGMATRPESRGLGLGRLLCLAALAEARRRGRRQAVLHSTPMALPLYKGVGFREVARFAVFAEPQSFYA